MPRKSRSAQRATHSPKAPDNPATDGRGAPMIHGDPAAPNPIPAQQQGDSDAPTTPGVSLVPVRVAAPPQAAIVAPAPSSTEGVAAGRNPAPDLMEDEMIDVYPTQHAQRRLAQARRRLRTYPEAPVPARRFAYQGDAVDQRARYVGVPGVPQPPREQPLFVTLVPGTPDNGFRSPPVLPERSPPPRPGPSARRAPQVSRGFHAQVQGSPPMQSPPRAFPPHRALGVPGGSLARMPQGRPPQLVSLPTQFPGTPYSRSPGRTEVRRRQALQSGFSPPHALPPSRLPPIPQHPSVPLGISASRAGTSTLRSGISSPQPGTSAAPSGSPQFAQPLLQNRTPQRGGPRTTPSSSSHHPSTVSPNARQMHTSPMEDPEDVSESPRKRQRVTEDQDEVPDHPGNRLPMPAPDYGELKFILDGYDPRNPDELMNSTRVQEECKEAFAAYHQRAERVLNKKIEELKKAHREEVKKMNALTSSNVTSRGNMMDPSRKCNEKFGHADELKKKALEAERLKIAAQADANAATLMVRELKTQLREEKEKAQLLSNEVKELRLVEWTVASLEARRYQEEPVRSGPVTLEEVLICERHLKKRQEEINKLRKKLEGPPTVGNKAGSDNPSHDTLAASMAKLRLGMKKLAETALSADSEVTDVAPEKFLEPKTEEEALQWLDIWKKLKVAYKGRGALVKHKNALVKNFRDGYNELLVLESDLYHTSYEDVKEKKRKHEEFVKAFDARKLEYVKLAEESNTAARAKKEAERHMKKAIADVKKKRDETK